MDLTVRQPLNHLAGDLSVLQAEPHGQRPPPGRLAPTPRERRAPGPPAAVARPQVPGPPSSPAVRPLPGALKSDAGRGRGEETGCDPKFPAPIQVRLCRKQAPPPLNLQTKAGHPGPTVPGVSYRRSSGSEGAEEFLILIVKSTSRKIKLKCVTDRRRKSRQP